MTIRRQYSLPSCTLILDGLGNGTEAYQNRPFLLSLVNAECHLAGQAQPIGGGLEFLQQLIVAVNNYTQSLLSKVVPSPNQHQVSKIHLSPGAKDNQHRLIATDESGTPVAWDLTTVQLFDLVEAIDQFLADSSTLPEMQVVLQPTSRKASQGLARQTAPIGLGLSGLAATALAFSLWPTPTKVVPLSQPSATPAAATSTKPTAASAPSGSASPPATTGASTSPSPSATTSASPQASDRSQSLPMNSDATQVAFIERKLRREINQAWQDRKGISTKLEYRVYANESGELVSYQPKSDLAKSKQDLTPFPKLVPSPQATPDNNLAEYTVGFTPNGALEIRRFRALPSPTLGKAIDSADTIKTLAAQVNTKVQLTSKPNFKQDLTYRVAADEQGKIVDYEPLNQPAFDYEKDTPLPQVTQYDRAAATGQKPLAQYKVTYQTNGSAKVEPQK